MARVEKKPTKIVQTLEPYQEESQKGKINCDQCGKFYAEWHCVDEGRNFCIWCNISWHSPIGKLNHIRRAIDGRPEFVGTPFTPKIAAKAVSGGIQEGELILYLETGTYYMGVCVNFEQKTVTDFQDGEDDVFECEEIIPVTVERVAEMLDDYLVKETMIGEQNTAECIEEAVADVLEKLGKNEIEYMIADDSEGHAVMMELLSVLEWMAPVSNEFRQMLGHWEAQCQMLDAEESGIIQADSIKAAYHGVLTAASDMTKAKIEYLKAVLASLEGVDV